MKLYANIQKQSQTNPSGIQQQPPNTPNTNQINNNLNLQPQPQGFSFKIQPNKQYQLGMAALNLYHLPTHISLVDQPLRKDHFHEGSASATRSTTPRKKIFDEQNILFRLMEPVAEHIKAQSAITATQNSSPDYEPRPPKDLTSYIKPRQKAVSAQNVNQKMQKPMDQSFRRVNKSFQQETIQQKQQTYRILAQPILGQQRQTKSIIQNRPFDPATPIRNEIQAKIPQLLERIDRNDKAIKQLNSKVDQLVRLQNQKHLTLRKDLTYKQKTLEEKQQKLQSQIKHLQEQQQTLKNQNSKTSHLEKQQARRIQQLVEENKMLCSKVLEQRARNSKIQKHQDSQYLKAKIAYLQLQRQTLQREKQMRSLRNLDISIIPHQKDPVQTIKQQIIPSNQRPSQVISGNQSQNQLFETKQLIQHTSSNMDYRYHSLGIREVKVTKMY